MVEVFGNDLAEGDGGGGVVVVCTADGLRDDVVDELEFHQVGGDEFHGLGGLGGVLAVLPEDGGAALGGDDGVVGVLHHDNAVGDADAEGTAGTALADDYGDDGGFQQHHLAEVEGDGLGDVALLRTDAGEGSGGVDEGDDGHGEFLRELHQAEGLAVALGVGGAEVALEVLLGVAAFLVAEDDAFPLAEHREAAGHRGVVADVAVAVELGEVFEGQRDVIEHERALGVAGDLYALPRGEVLVDGRARLCELAFHGRDLFRQVEVLPCGLGAELLDLTLNLGGGLFEFEELHVFKNSKLKI